MSGIPWNKGLTKEIDERVKKVGPKGKHWKCSGEHNRKVSIALLGKPKSEEHNRKNRETHSGENNYGWKGGLYDWYHSKAKSLFGTSVCERCGITLEEYKLTHERGFHMHCINKDWKILEQWNWQCLCQKCHNKTYRNVNKWIKQNEMGIR